VAQDKSAVAPYFRNLEQQREVNQLGMWAFLVTEVMLIGGGFAAYAVYFYNYSAGFTEASQHLDLTLSTINTLVLLCSSLTMAMAVRSAQTNKRKALVTFLILTIVLGTAFLALKGVEYYEEYEKHLIPGLNFAYEGVYAQQAELFFALYFAMTGLHASHMMVGIPLLVYFTIRAWQNHYSSVNYDSVENMGLFWHFVDIVWVFIFPLFYLIER